MDASELEEQKAHDYRMKERQELHEAQAEVKRLRRVEHVAREYVHTRNHYPQVAGEMWRELTKVLGLWPEEPTESEDSNG